MLVEQFGSTVMTVAKDVKVQVEFNPAHAAGYRLLGYEDRRMRSRDFRDDAKDSGEIGAGHAVTMLFEIVPAGRSVPGVETTATEASEVTYGGDDKELLTVRLRYKPPLGDKAREESHALPLPKTLPAQVSGDFDFAASVAAFGMLLRESPYAGTFGWEDVLALAKRSRGERPEPPPRRGGQGRDRPRACRPVRQARGARRGTHPPHADPLP